MDAVKMSLLEQIEELQYNLSKARQLPLQGSSERELHELIYILAAAIKLLLRESA